MATIGSLSARILADASGVRSGIAATKEQLKIARQAFIESRTDAEKYGAALDKLNAAKDAGVFGDDPAAYARALAALRAELDPVTIRKNKLRESVGALTKQLKDEAATVGLSTDQLELYRLKQQGANEATLKSIAYLQAKRNALQQANTKVVDATVNYTAMGESIRNVAGTVTALAGGMTAGLGLLGRELLKTADASTELQRLQASSAALKTEFGGLLQDALRPAYAAMGDLVDGLRNLDGGTKTAITYAGLFAFELGSVVTSAAGAATAAGQIITAYGHLTKTAMGAAIAQRALSAAVGVGYVAAAVAAVAAGYQLGQSLYDLTEAGRTAQRMYEDFADTVQTLATADFSGSNTADLRKYIEATDQQISKIRQHNSELQASQGWSNLWQANADLIDANNAKVDQLQANLGRARRELAQMTGGGPTAGATPAASAAGPTGKPAAATFDPSQMVRSMQQQIAWAGASEDQLTLLRLQAAGLGNDWLHVLGVMQRDLGVAKRTAEARAEVERMNQALRDQIAQQQLAAQGWSPEQIQAWTLAQQGASAEQLQQLAILQQQTAALKAQQDAKTAQQQREQALQNTLQDTTKRYQEQLATAGMSANEIELWKLAQQGATREQLAQVAALQAAAGGKNPARHDKSLATLPTAAIAGTREAAERIAAYRDRQSDPRQKFEEKQLSLQERIASTLDKILVASGLTVEEVT